MDLLEDQAFVTQFLQRSQRCLLESRLLAEDLLIKGGIAFYREGYVIEPMEIVRCLFDNPSGTPAFFFGWISALIFPLLSATAMDGQLKDCCQGGS
jgi:hypothetical protein